MTHRETAILLAFNEVLTRFTASPGEALVLGLTLAGTIGVNMGVPLPELAETLTECYDRAEGAAQFEQRRKAV